ncbi:MAG: hypothetical protein Ct9H300mP7_0780 [Verrucomicrobiota bacterium]|nr:MAG: hypothetical protein Ct9H300mP7_0780 [Verrucomicrobiota bacterium]
MAVPRLSAYGADGDRHRHRLSEAVIYRSGSLGNAIAAHAQLGAPVVGVDFGTAVTFDIVDEAANYTGGIMRRACRR